MLDPTGQTLDGATNSDGAGSALGYAAPSALAAASEVSAWRVIILCTLVCVVDGYDMAAAPVAAPSMTLDWNLAPQQFSVALAASTSAWPSAARSWHRSAIESDAVH